MTKDIYDMTMKEYAQHIGVSERTVYRQKRDWIIKDGLKREKATPEEAENCLAQERAIRDICQARANLRRVKKRRELWCPEIMVAARDIMVLMADWYSELEDGG